MKRPRTTAPRPESDAVSLHTTPDNYQYFDPLDTDLPPPYAESELAASSSDGLSQLRLPDHVLTEHAHRPDDYQPSDPAGGVRGQLELRPHDTKETTIRIDERLQDPYHLYAYIMDYLRAQPPLPVVRVHGHHLETTTERVGKRKEKKTKQVTDFDIEISLQSLLRDGFDGQMWNEHLVDDDESAYRGSFRKTRAPAQPQAVYLTDNAKPDLKEWCERYCASSAQWKVFRVHRETQGFNHELLTTMLSEMVRSTNYGGRLDITFPVYQQNVDIYSPHWVNYWRTSWVRFIFYGTMLWIITWPILFFFTRWYCVYTVSWYNSIFTPDPANPQRGRVTYATLSERDWFTAHRGYLRHLVIQRHQGWAASEQAVEWNRGEGSRDLRT